MTKSSSNAQSLLSIFLDPKILERAFPAPLFTGLPSLDEALSGGLYPALYVIGAAPAIGKTSLALQIAYNVAKSGRHVCFFTGTENEKTLFAKAVSRLLFEKCKSQKKMAFAKTAREILTRCNKDGVVNKEGIKMFHDAVNECARAWEHIHVIQNVPEGEWAPSRNGDVCYEYKGRRLEGFRKKITSIDSHPLMIVDYIQDWASFCGMSTDIQNIKELMIGLKMISMEYEIPVVALSAISAGKYHAPLELDSFKGSSQIEISSDVLLGLQLDGWDYKNWESTESRTWRVGDLQKRQKNRGEAGWSQHMELKMLKNRNGGTEQSVLLNFYPKYGCFRERERKKSIVGDMPDDVIVDDVD